MSTVLETSAKGACETMPLLQSVLLVLVLNTVIALGLSAFGNSDFADNMVYSHCIGFCIWLMVNITLRTFVADRNLHWRRLFWIAPLGITLGYIAGFHAAAWLLHHSTAGLWTEHPRQLLGYLCISLLAGGGMTYYFLSREQLAGAREEMARRDAQFEAAQRHATEAQLKLLETQLEPHMLFNTLANLRALIGVDAERAKEMLDRLVSYLRATLAASRASTYALGAEFERLHDYLELMTVRMGTRLRFALALPPELESQPIPPLLLQALVENSIKHGLEPKIEGGRIDISARRDGPLLVLQVQDDGVGLPDEQEAPIGNSGSFGLAQVRERLQASYGSRGTIDMAASPNGGTLVTITFPAMTS